MKVRTNLLKLQDIPNVGPAIARDFIQVGITEPAALVGQDPYELFDRLCSVTGIRHDPCVIDVFISAVRYMEGHPKKMWWEYTAERKKYLRGGDDT